MANAPDAAAENPTSAAAETGDEDELSEEEQELEDEEAVAGAVTRIEAGAQSTAAEVQRNPGSVEADGGQMNDEERERQQSLEDRITEETRDTKERLKERAFFRRGREAEEQNPYLDGLRGNIEHKLQQLYTLYEKLSTKPLEKDEKRVYKKLVGKEAGEEQKTIEGLSEKKQAVLAREQFTEDEYDQMQSGEIPWTLNAVWQAIRDVRAGNIKPEAPEPAPATPAAGAPTGTPRAIAAEAAIAAGMVTASSAADYGDYGQRWEPKPPAAAAAPIEKPATPAAAPAETKEQPAELPPSITRDLDKTHARRMSDAERTINAPGYDRAVNPESKRVEAIITDMRTTVEPQAIREQLKRGFYLNDAESKSLNDQGVIQFKERLMKDLNILLEHMNATAVVLPPEQAPAAKENETEKVNVLLTQLKEAQQKYLEETERSDAEMIAKPDYRAGRISNLYRGRIDRIDNPNRSPADYVNTVLTDIWTDEQRKLIIDQGKAAEVVQMERQMNIDLRDAATIAEANRAAAPIETPAPAPAETAPPAEAENQPPSPEEVVNPDIVEEPPAEALTREITLPPPAAPTETAAPTPIAAEETRKIVENQPTKQFPASLRKDFTTLKLKMDPKVMEGLFDNGTLIKLKEIVKEMKVEKDARTDLKNDKKGLELFTKAYQDRVDAALKK
jgi:hypothetical protein